MIAIPSLFKESVAQYLKNYLHIVKLQFGSEQVKNWAEKIGITSRITFKHIVHGRKSLTTEQMQDLKKILDLSESERQLLGKNSLLASGGVASATTSENFFISPDFFSTPLNTIVLNLCALNKNLNSIDIQKILAKKYSFQDISQSIAHLLELKLIQENSDGSLKRIFHGTLTTLPGVKSTSSREYFKHTYELADKAWEEPLHMREINAFTFKIDAEDVPKMKDLIRKLRHDLNELSKNANNDSLYQCSIAAVPIYIGAEENGAK